MPGAAATDAQQGQENFVVNFQNGGWVAIAVPLAAAGTIAVAGIAVTAASSAPAAAVVNAVRGLGTVAAGKLASVIARASPAAQEEASAAQSESAASTGIARFYPPNNGVIGDTSRVWLKPGDVIDRFGGEGGRYVSPLGTPLEARALPPGSDLESYGAYQVAKPFEVQAGTTNPWFWGGGFGTQYQLPLAVRTLIKYGVLEPLEQ